MARYQGVDFYDIYELLSDEEVSIRDAVRGWTEDNVIPIIEEHCRAGTFPRHLAADMGSMGFLGANLHGYDACRCKTVQTMTGAFSRVDVHTTLHATRLFPRR